MNTLWNLLRGSWRWLRAGVIVIGCLLDMAGVIVRVGLAYLFSDRMPTERVERAVGLGSRASHRQRMPPQDDRQDSTRPAAYPLSAYQHIGETPLWLFDAAWDECDPRDGLEDVPVTQDTRDTPESAPEPAQQPAQQQQSEQPEQTTTGAVEVAEDLVLYTLTTEQMEELLDMARWYSEDPHGVFTSRRNRGRTQQ